VNYRHQRKAASVEIDQRSQKRLALCFPMNRNNLYLRLSLIWLAAVIIGVAFVLMQ
jgi:hypothetical protein